MTITREFQDKTLDALFRRRQLFGGTDTQFAKQFGINPTTYSVLKKRGDMHGLLKSTKWIELARELDVSPREKKWNLARTEVFEAIRNDVEFCQRESKSLIFVDEPEIGKTVTGKYLARTLPNCFYIDCSQSKTKSLFTRALARAIGLDQTGTYADMKANIKFALNTMEKVVVILDEAGDLTYTAFLDVKEYWNATDGNCGWYMMGADGLRTMIESGINRRKVGFREIFSRFSSNYMSVVPRDRTQRIEFYRQLVGDVLEANVDDKAQIPPLVKKCLTSADGGAIGGLRRAESLLILSRAQ